VRKVVRLVKTNAAIKDGATRTDIDIVALSDNTLYLFECKHSITPTGPHEMRDLWRDIQKGISQLEVALAILSVRLADYLAGWFPGTARDMARHVRIRPVVLCSHRVFSGLTLRGIPVRDYASLGHVLGDGIVRTGTPKDDKTVEVIRYRLRAAEDPSPADLDNYLGGQSTFFRMFEPFMRPYTAIDYVRDKVILAQESFVYQLNDEAWQANLESLGAHRLPDEEVTIGPAQPPEVT
jgi:hypothetical protein